MRRWPMPTLFISGDREGERWQLVSDSLVRWMPAARKVLIPRRRARGALRRAPAVQRRAARVPAGREEGGLGEVAEQRRITGKLPRATAAEQVVVHLTRSFILWRRLDLPGHDAAGLRQTAGGAELRGMAVFQDEAGRLHFVIAWVATRSGGAPKPLSRAGVGPEPSLCGFDAPPTAPGP